MFDRCGEKGVKSTIEKRSRRCLLGVGESKEETTRVGRSFVCSSGVRKRKKERITRVGRIYRCFSGVGGMGGGNVAGVGRSFR